MFSNLSEFFCQFWFLKVLTCEIRILTFDFSLTSTIFQPQNRKKSRQFTEITITYNSPHFNETFGRPQKTQIHFLTFCYCQIFLFWFKFFRCFFSFADSSCFALRRASCRACCAWDTPCCTARCVIRQTKSRNLSRKNSHGNARECTIYTVWNCTRKVAIFSTFLLIFPKNDFGVKIVIYYQIIERIRIE